MKPGDPYDTEEREQRRAEQRRALRSLPDNILEEARQGVRPARSIGEIDAPVLEAALRDLAQREIDTLRDYLDQSGEVEVARLMNQIITSSVDPAKPAFTSLEPILSDVQSRAGTSATPQGDQGHAIVRLVAFLLWADDLADDGYQDPRIPF